MKLCHAVYGMRHRVPIAIVLALLIRRNTMRRSLSISSSSEKPQQVPCVVHPFFGTLTGYLVDSLRKVDSFSALR